MGGTISSMMEPQKSTYREQCDRRRKYSPLVWENGSEPCQVRSKTDNPCPYPAAVKIREVSFCARCARKQVAYFAIGDLTQAQEQSDLGAPRVGMPEQARWKLVRRIIEAAKRDGRHNRSRNRGSAGCSQTITERI